VSGPATATALQLDLVFARRGARTVLDRRFFRYPFVLARSFALDTARPEMLTLVVQNSAGPIHGGDRLETHIRVGREAAAYVTGQGAAAVHRPPPGATSREAARLVVGDSARLEYFPPPRILFPDAALESVLDVDCAPTGVALIAEAFTFHDPEAAGRAFHLLDTTLRVRRAGGPTLLLDRQRLEDPSLTRLTPNRAFGTLTLIAPLGDARALAQGLTHLLGGISDIYGAASVLPNALGLNVRLAAEHLEPVRAATDLMAKEIKAALAGETMPEPLIGGR